MVKNKNVDCNTKIKLRDTVPSLKQHDQYKCREYNSIQPRIALFNSEQCNLKRKKGNQTS